MKIEIHMPSLGYDMETGVLTRWLKSVGDPVERGEPIAEVDTDKATLEMEASASGTLVEIVAAEGAEVPVNDVIGYLESDS